MPQVVVHERGRGMEEGDCHQEVGGEAVPGAEHHVVVYRLAARLAPAYSAAIPASPSVGTSGMIEARFDCATAKAFNLPAST